MPTRLLKPRDIVSTPVTVVEIDEPEPRAARAVAMAAHRAGRVDPRALRSERPAAIGIDILMPEPDRLSPERLLARTRQADPGARESPRRRCRRTTAELAHAIADAPVVLGARRHARPDRTRGCARRRSSSSTADRGIVPSDAGCRGLPHFAGALTSIDVLDRAAAGHGLISVGSRTMSSGAFRWSASIDGTLVPSLSIEMLRVALRAPGVAPVRRRPDGRERLPSAISSPPRKATGTPHLLFAARIPGASCRRSTSSTARSTRCASSKSWC